MSNAYVGVEGLARKVNALYVGVDGAARKVIKGYIGDTSGIARQFYSAAQPFAYTYTGTYTEAERVIDGVAYIVLTLTSSGTLTANRAISADVWLCGGGANGADGNGKNGAILSGGGGGGGYIASANVQISGNIACIIGAAAGASSLDTLSASGGGAPDGRHGGDGGSGGGGGIAAHAMLVGQGGQGGGVSTAPVAFGVADKHSAGGKGGDAIRSISSTSTRYYWGGNGGSGGENGQDCDGISRTNQSTPTYADKGGGTGGGTDAVHWEPQLLNATYYGSGGGGGSNDSDRGPNGGSGYQGVIYIRWKKEDAA